MFRNLIKYPIEDEHLQWEARYLVQNLNKEPHLLLRLKISGTFFPQRALEPFVLVEKIRSKFVKISKDGKIAYAYFTEPLKGGGIIQFGYGQEILLKFPKPFGKEKLKLLEVDRLPKNVRFLKKFFTDDS